MQQRLCSGTIVVLLLWPIPHFQAVQRLDVNPWKLFGFAMYCTPHAVDVRLRARADGAIREIAPNEAPANALPLMAEFVRKRRLLGRLVRPDALAAAMLRQQPTIDELLVEVSVTRLDGSRAAMTTRRSTYSYHSEAAP